MELEKVLRLISDNKDIRPDEFDKILAPALKEEVITVRDIVAKSRYGVAFGLVTQDPISISDGCFGWAVKFKIGEGSFQVYTVTVSVYVIQGGEMSHQPNLIVSLTKEDGTCLYSGNWNYPKDGMPCLKCVILEAMDKAGMDKAGIAWYDAKNDKTTTLKEALAMIVVNKDIDSNTIDIAVMNALHRTVVQTKEKCIKDAFNDRVLPLGKVNTSPRTWDKDNTTAQWKSVFTAGHCDIAVMVTVCNFGVYAYNPNISVSVSAIGSPDEPCNPTRYICNPTMYLDNVCFHEFSGTDTLYDMMVRALQHIDNDGHIVDTFKQVADKKEWFFLEFWKHDNTLRDVYHDVDLSALKRLWVEENKHYICTPITTGILPNMETSNEHT